MTGEAVRPLRMTTAGLRRVAWFIVAVAMVCSAPPARSEVAAARAGYADAGFGAKGPGAPGWEARAEEEALPNVWKALAGLVHHAKQALLGARRRLEQEELWPASLDLAADGLSRSAAAAVGRATTVEARLREAAQDLGLKFCGAGSACSRTGQLLSGVAASPLARSLRASAEALWVRGFAVWRQHVMPRLRRLLLLLLRAADKAAQAAAPHASRVWGVVSTALRHAAEGALPAAKKVSVFLRNCNTRVGRVVGAFLRAVRETAKLVKDVATGCSGYAPDDEGCVMRKIVGRARNATGRVREYARGVPGRIASRVNETLHATILQPRESVCPVTAMFRNISKAFGRTVCVGRGAAGKARDLLKLPPSWFNAWREALVRKYTAVFAREPRGGDAAGGGEKASDSAEEKSPYGPAVTEWFITQKEGGAEKDEASRYVVLRHGGGAFLLLSLNSNGWFRHVIASGEHQSSSVMYPSGTMQPADHVGASDLLDMLRDKNTEKTIGKLPRSGKKIGNWHFKTAGDSLVITNMMHKQEATPPRLVLTGDGFLFSGFSGGVMERGGQQRAVMSREETDAVLRAVLGSRA